MSKTFAIIKPDAVKRGLIGKIISRIETAGLKIVAARLLHMSLGDARGFYAVHSERPFFDDLTRYMSSGPSMALALEGDRALERWRELLGATNPKEAAEGTIRADFALDIEKNSAHGSDSDENAAKEISYFFAELDIVRR